MISYFKYLLRNNISKTLDNNPYLKAKAKIYEETYWAHVFGNVADQVFDKHYGAHDLYIGYDIYSLSAAKKLVKKNDKSLLFLDISHTTSKGDPSNLKATQSSAVSKYYFKKQLDSCLKICKLLFTPNVDIYKKLHLSTDTLLLPNISKSRNISDNYGGLSLKEKLKINNKKKTIAYSGNISDLLNAAEIIDFLEANSRKYQLVLFFTNDEDAQECKIKINCKNIFFSKIGTYDEYLSDLSECDFGLIISADSITHRYNEIFSLVHSEIPILFNNECTEINYWNNLKQIGNSYDAKNENSFLNAINEISKLQLDFEANSAFYSWGEFEKKILTKIQSIVPKNSETFKVCLLYRGDVHKNLRIYRMVNTLLEYHERLYINILCYDYKNIKWKRNHPRVKFISIDEISKGSLPRKFRKNTIKPISKLRTKIQKNTRQVEQSEVFRLRQQARRASLKVSSSDFYRLNERSANFAASLISYAKGKVNYDAVITHEMFSLDAAIALSNCSMPKPYLVYDSVEYPDVSGRSLGTPLSLLDDGGTQLFNLKHIINANEMDQVFTTSEGQSSKLIDMGLKTDCKTLKNYHKSENWINIPNFTNVSNFREKLNIPKNKIILLHPNNIYEGGGFQLLLEALKLLPNKYVVVCLAKMYSNNEVNSYLNDTSINKRIYFCDPVDPSELVSLTSSADISIIPLPDNHPNYKTCLPNRLFDSYAARLPVIAMENTAIGNNVKKYKTGQVVKNNSPQDMAKKIEKIYLNRKNIVKNIDNFCKNNNWEKEMLPLLNCLKTVSVKKVLLVANKGIETNARISRLSESLRNDGIDLTVFAKSLPNDDIKVSGVQYVNSNDVIF
jgi:glycosyltransferase involved in cell wall biosynthesis